MILHILVGVYCRVQNPVDCARVFTPPLPEKQGNGCFLGGGCGVWRGPWRIFVRKFVEIRFEVAIGSMFQGSILRFLQITPFTHWSGVRIHVAGEGCQWVVDNFLANIYGSISPISAGLLRSLSLL